GPICYGRGGTQPTISDANILLGRLNPDKLLAVANQMSVQSIADIFERELGRPLGLSAEQAADAVLRVANAHMAGAIRMVSISLGADPRDYALFAFGGAGPLHATALARELSIPRVLVPSRPGITNALGCVVADLRHDFVNTINAPVDAIDLHQVHDIFARQTAEGERLIEKEPVGITEIRHVFSADMQFIGQTHLLRVSLPGPTPDQATLQRLFEQAYFDRFRVELPEIRANLVNLNASIIGVRPPVDLSTLIDPATRETTLAAAAMPSRRVWFDGQWRDTPVYWRDKLPIGCRIEGPAIIEQMDTTIVIDPDNVATDDDDGNIHIQIAGD
ncbi:MAG: hydantoinase/oxoprolinase family protein, partial [Alphaproteobacteria bacterium]